MENTNYTEKKDRDIEFAQRIRGLANRMNLTQVQISERLDVSSARVGNWFQGNNKPKSPVKERLADLLQVSESFLIDGIPETKEPKDKYSLSRIQNTTVNEAPGRFSHSRDPLNINPPYQLQQPSSSSLKKIDDYMRPWMEAAARSADVASYVMTQLKLNLPHAHIEVIEKDPDDD